MCLPTSLDREGFWALGVQAWFSGWWKAEWEEALRQLNDILDAEAAWQPALALWGSAPSDGLEDEFSMEEADELRHAKSIRQHYLLLSTAYHFLLHPWHAGKVTAGLVAACHEQ